MIEYSNRAPVEAISGQEPVPVIEDDGEVVHDSVAIMRHLERRTPEPPLFPADAARRAALDLFIDETRLFSDSSTCGGRGRVFRAPALRQSDQGSIARHVVCGRGPRFGFGGGDLLPTEGLLLG